MAQSIKTSSESSSVSETVDGSHEFTIKGYSLAKGMGIGKYIQSDTFTVGGFDWAVYFYPDGKNPEDNSVYVSAFIALVSEGIDVRALFELTLFDQSGKGKHKVHSHFDRSLDSGPYALKYRGSMWGYKRFLKRASLEASDYLKNDCIVMHCTVGVVRTRVEGPKKYTIHIPPSDMGEGFKDLLESEAGYDIVLNVGEETFKAHKLILAARSPVFKAKLFGPLRDCNENEIVVKDVEPSIFKAMVQFIYTDKLPDLSEISCSTSNRTSTVMIQHLLVAADLYHLERLKLLCEAKLCKEINTETVAAILQLSEQHHCPQLKAVCIKYAVDPVNFGDVMKSEGYKHLEENCKSLIDWMLNTLASGDENISQQPSRKRGSSVYGLDLAADGTDDKSMNSSGRRVCRRF